MNIPEKVKIGAHLYFVEQEIDPSNDDDNCFGCSSFKKLKIVINPSYAKSQQEETFFHEVLHCIDNALGYATKTAEEEQRVQSTAHLFYEFLKDNNLLK